MSRIGYISILLLIGTVLAAATQNPAPPPKQAPPSAQPKLEHLQQFHAEGVVGLQVTDQEGNAIGSIVNVLIDQKGEPSAAVIEFEGFLGVGNRDIAVAWTALRFSQSGGGVAVTTTLDADRLKALPQYVPDQPSVPVATRPHAAKTTP